MEEFEVFGQARGMKLGAYTFKLINQATGTKSIQDVLERFTQGDHGFNCEFYYCCAKHWAMSKKKEIDFQEVDVIDWLDELGPVKVKEITDNLFKVYIEKNLKAPATGQELQSSNGKH